MPVQEASIQVQDVEATPHQDRWRGRPLLLGMGWFPDQPGGANRYFVGLHHALAARLQACPAVVTGPAATPPAEVCLAGGVDESTPLRVLRYASAAIRRIGNADIVNVHFALYGLLPTLAARLRGKRLVVHFHGPWADESAAAGEAHRAMKRAIERVVYRSSSTIIVLSGAFKRVLIERYGICPWAVHVVPPGVELDRFKPGDRTHARARLGIDRRTWVAVAARRLVPRMGIDVLLDAWARAGDNLQDAHLLIVGEGSARSALEEQADALGLTGRVQFLGRVDEDMLLACYQAADVCVVPSRSLEGFGLTVLEALACGTPVVASHAGGLPEALAGLDPSLIVPAGDSAALSLRLQGACDGHHPLPSREACRNYARQFSWERAAERVLGIYREAVQPSGHRKPRVVVVDHCARLSGGELALLRLLPALQEVEFHVILGEDGPLASKLALAGISVEVLPMHTSARDLQRGRVRPNGLPLASALTAAAYTIRLARRLQRLRPDLVHTNSLKAALYGGVAARIIGVPVIWHIRDRIAKDYLPGPAVLLLRRLARSIPMAVLADTRAILATLPGVDGTVVPSPVEVQDPSRSKASPLPGPFRIGMVGRLASWKGQHVFIEAFARAFPNGEAEAVIVGSALFEADKPYAASLQPLAKKVGIADSVVFTGFREDVVSELSKLHVLVHASVVPEPFGLVIVEGMAAGLAVVASDQGGPAEVIDHGVNGLLVPPNDTVALATVLRQLAAQPRLRQELGAEAKRRASEFTPRSSAVRVLKLYREVLDASAEVAMTK